MIQLPNGKVCRNLPEQVAENLRLITLLIEFISSSDIAKNLIEVDSSIGALNDSQKEIANRDSAIIKYQNEYYFKSEITNDDKILFVKLNYSVSEETSPEGIDYYEFSSEYFEVQMPAGSYELKSDTLSVANISEIINKFAQLSGATFTGDVIARTLKQTQANFKYEFEIDVADTVNFEKYGTQYCRFETVNGELHLIICAMFHNIDTVNQHNMSLVVQEIPNIPEEISEKIYTCGGQKVSETPAASPNNIIRIAPLGLQGSGVAIAPVRLYHSGANKVSLYGPTGQNVLADGIGIITLEVNLSLL